MNLTAIYKISTQDRLEKLTESIMKLPDCVETVVISDIPVEYITADVVVKTEESSLTEARNMGVKYSTNDTVAFIDDDAYPSEGWVERILKGFKHADMVGGPLYPDYKNGEIRWLPKGWHWLIGCGPYYEQERMVPNTYGSNLAITKKAFESVGGFDESIGMGSNGVGQGAETDLCRRVRKAGYTGVWYDPGAIMYHIIDGRNSLRGLHKRAYEQGKAKAEVGVSDREGQFVKEELFALGGRTLKRGLATITLTTCVGMGYLTGQVWG